MRVDSRHLDPAGALAEADVEHVRVDPGRGARGHVERPGQEDVLGCTDDALILVHLHSKRP